MLNVLHSSDLHGDWKDVLRFRNFDVWIDSGDFFPNKTRGTPEEKRYQTRWFANKGVGERLTEWLAGRPLISVSGNHDYVSLTKLMREAGARAYQATPKGVEVDGVEYAGFRQVPYIFGEWAGETHQGDFRSLVDEVFDVPPDILVTHAGPADILSGGDRYHGGINSLASALAWQPHTIQAHFFGHDHEFGSQTREEVGVIFSNSATKPKIVHIAGLRPTQNPSKPRRTRRPRRARRSRGA